MPVIPLPLQLYQTRPQFSSLFFWHLYGYTKAFVLLSNHLFLLFLAVNRLQYIVEACLIDRHLSYRGRDQWQRRICFCLVTWKFHRILQAHDSTSLVVNSAVIRHDAQKFSALIIVFILVQLVSLQAVGQIQSNPHETFQAVKTSINIHIAISYFPPR